MRIKSRDKRKARLQKYRARESNVSNVGGLFIFGNLYKRAEENHNLNDEQISQISICTRLALQQMLFGDSTGNDWGQIAGAINTALMLSEQGYGSEHEHLFIRAQEALTKSYERGMRTNAWRFDGEGIEDIKNAIEIHETQCDHVTIGDIREALDEVARRIDAGHTYQIERVGA